MQNGTHTAQIAQIAVRVPDELLARLDQQIPQRFSSRAEKVRDGMPESCAASFDNLRTVPRSMMVTKLTRLSTERLPEICDAISFALECD